MSTTTQTSSLVVASPLHPNVVLLHRPSETRGGANVGWLKTLHTFSLAMHRNGEFTPWRVLQAINENRLEPGSGFGTGRDLFQEICYYIVSGELEHKDSMGNTEILRKGNLELCSAGTIGFKHSEITHGPKQVHFLQISVAPFVLDREPNYFKRHFTDEEKMDKWVRVVAPTEDEGVSTEREASGPAPIKAPLSLYATLLSPSSSVVHKFSRPGPGEIQHHGYIHVIQTTGHNPGKATGATVQLNRGLTLSEGDGAFAIAGDSEIIEIVNISSKVAKILLFDVFGEPGVLE